MKDPKGSMSAAGLTEEDRTIVLPRDLGAQLTHASVAKLSLSELLCSWLILIGEAESGQAALV
jgi:hypothetical protein